MFKHLRENKKGYLEHMLFALTCGIQCLLAGLCLIVHALLPALFEKTGSKIVDKVNSKLSPIV